MGGEQYGRAQNLGGVCSEDQSTSLYMNLRGSAPHINLLTSYGQHYFLGETKDLQQIINILWIFTDLLA